MTLDFNTLAVVGGVFINIVTLLNMSKSSERRLTEIETIVKILAGKEGLKID